MAAGLLAASPSQLYILVVPDFRLLKHFNSPSRMERNDGTEKGPLFPVEE